jgi:hypothetical protein
VEDKISKLEYKTHIKEKKQKNTQRKD